MSRILVLEDDALIAMMLAEWLQELGHEVLGPVGTDVAALTIIDGAGVDAALLDLRLGDGDSYAVAAALRSRGVPFAFASGYGPAGVLEEFRDCPILGKPYDFEGVDRLVKGWFDADGWAPSP